MWPRKKQLQERIGVDLSIQDHLVNASPKVPKAGLSVAKHAQLKFMKALFLSETYCKETGDSATSGDTFGVGVWGLVAFV